MASAAERFGEIPIPNTYDEAMGSKFADKWRCRLIYCVRSSTLSAFALGILAKAKARAKAVAEAVAEAAAHDKLMQDQGPALGRGWGGPRDGGQCWKLAEPSPRRRSGGKTSQ